jgi:RNA polymerase-binding transcription factor DksA
MSREAMQMALDMLNEIADDVYCDQKLEGVITVLRQALEEKQEPVVDEGYYCVVCGKYIEAVDDVIVHDDIPHPVDMAFDEEENPQ